MTRQTCTVYSVSTLYQRPPTPSNCFLLSIYSQRQLHGCTALITGANTGIGFETALELARRNARVVLACRNPLLMAAAVEQIKAQSGNTNIAGMVLDLGDIAQIREFAAQFLATEPRLDLLILNAGVMAVPTHTATKDGFEMQMGTNHLGHFLLTQLLVDRLKASAAIGKTGWGSRVVVVSSRAHKRAKTVDVADLNHEAPGSYSVCFIRLSVFKSPFVF